MTWYLAAYLAVFSVLGVAGVVEDRRSRRPPWFLLAMALTLGVGVLAVLAFAYPSLGRAVSPWLWVLLPLALAMDVWSLVLDLREASADPDLGRGGAAAAGLLTTLLVAPAYVLGVMAAGAAR